MMIISLKEASLSQMKPLADDGILEQSLSRSYYLVNLELKLFIYCMRDAAPVDGREYER